VTASLRFQGRLFCVLALALVIATLLGPRLEPRHELLAAAALVLLLGVPHGAFDVVLARRLFGVAEYKGWALFSLCYFGLSAAVVGLWMLTPTLFLCAFLALSALHFGGDPGRGTSRLSRVLYGGAVIVLPALWHGPELGRLLALVAGPKSAAFVTPVLSGLAAPWLAVTLFASALRARRSPLAAVELAALAALSLTAPPLVAFTVYFCAMHSPRHILRTLARLPATEVRGALQTALWPTLAVLAAAAGVAGLASGLPLETRVMQVVFVGLAALTLPHMALLEHARRRSRTATADNRAQPPRLDPTRRKRQRADGPACHRPRTDEPATPSSGNQGPVP
jgi:Brp/Blh family beta-carotene 15,15'-monooxygenase